VIVASGVEDEGEHADSGPVFTVDIRSIGPEDLRLAADATADLLGRLLATESSTGHGNPVPDATAPGSGRGSALRTARSRIDSGMVDRETLHLAACEGLAEGAFDEAVSLASHPSTCMDIPVRASVLVAGGHPLAALELVQNAASHGEASASLCLEAALLALEIESTDAARALLLSIRGRPDVPGWKVLIADAALDVAATDWAAARSHLETALELAPSGEARAEVSNALGGVLFRCGLRESAMESFERALGESSNEHREQARALHNIGLLALRNGRFTRAANLIQQAMLLADGLGEAYGSALSRRNLAIALEHLGRYQPALEYAIEAADRLARLGRPGDLAAACLTLADLLLTFGDWDRAGALVRHAEELGGRHPVVAARCSLQRARCRRLREGTDALPDLVAAHDGLLNLSQLDAAVLTAAMVSETALEAGDSNLAKEWAQRTLNGAGRQSPEATGRAHAVLGRIELAEGMPAQALERLSEARDMLAASGQREPLALVLAALAEAHEALGNNNAAQVLREESSALIDEMEQAIPAGHRNAFKARTDLAAPAGTGLVPANATTAASQATTVTHLVARPRLRHLVPRIVGRSAELDRVLLMLERVRDVPIPLLLQGESGTGKELFAEALHRFSPRANATFVRVNAAAFTDTLLLSELFGHERGAFTGAHTRRIGKFEAAHGGTLLLDEIGDVSDHLQTALLRVIEEQRFQRVGGSEDVRVDVRLIFATNRDLEARVREGHFRKDLFHRIAGMTVDVPPLRRRREDIPLLVRVFLDELEAEAGRKVEVTDEAMACLEAHSWPGNIRELKNVVRRVALLTDGGDLTLESLSREAPAVVKSSGAPVEGSLEVFDLVFQRGLSLFEARREMEVALIREALERSAGNITEAARLLGMKRPRLSQMVKEYDLKVRAVRAAGEVP
jgi:transcriptional regulator with GAF, ATPase, and Fis domain/Tfp pilus assembly protein PilF